MTSTQAPRRPARPTLDSDFPHSAGGGSSHAASNPTAGAGELRLVLPGQPRTELNELSARASQTTALRIPRDELEAQSLACTHLVLACRQAIDDLSLEGEHGAKTNERAVEILREIQCDWSTALKALRRLARR